MDTIDRYIDRLLVDRHLESSGYLTLLSTYGDSVTDRLTKAAREVTDRRFGRNIYVRGLVEITNRCRNDCYYCGLRRSNTLVERYALTEQQIVECCRYGYGLGFRTFVLQGGEGGIDDRSIERVVGVLRSLFPDAAITLSLGERSEQSYRRWREAGADRYLLRHESYDAAHYGRLHPAAMSRDNRLHCLNVLRQLGYQTGTGMMIGSPFQSVDMLVEDVEFIERFAPEMVGMGPFVAQHNTPFAGFASGSVDLALRLIAIVRLLLPDALIPATTALATVDRRGRERAVEAGANVVMPNLSPEWSRSRYAIYDNKAATGSEAAEGLKLTADLFAQAGYQIDMGRGDYCSTTK